MSQESSSPSSNTADIPPDSQNVVQLFIGGTAA